MEIKVGDTVKVITGKDAGKQSRVARVFPKLDRLIVEGVNTAKRHQRPRGRTMQGGIVDKDLPIHASNVMIVCPQCGPVRIGHRFHEDGTKHRVCVKCKGEL